MPTVDDGNGNTMTDDQRDDTMEVRRSGLV